MKNSTKVNIDGTLIEVPTEFQDYLKVVAFGARKYGDLNWLQPNGSKSSHKDMHASIFRHVAQSFCNDLEDEDTGLDPLLHAATRCLMVYTRRQRGLKHEDDA